MIFKEFCSFQEGYVNPSQKINDYFDGPVKWLRATDLNNSNVFSTSKTLTEKGFRSAGKSAKLFKPNTIAISKSGTIGRLGILKDFMCGNRAVINLEIDESKMDTKFIFFWLFWNSPNIQELAVGSVQKNLYVSSLEHLDVGDFDLQDQKSIAHILSTLDDKIEVNNRINKTLEDMAQAIFKRWFVDFEFPNEDGEPYKSSGGEMIESELGMLPKGWKIKELYSLGEYINGTSFKKTEKTGFSSIPIIKIAEIKNGYSGQTEYLIESNKKEDKLFLKRKDILFSWSGNPETSIDIFIWPKDEGILNQHIFRVVPSFVEKSVLFFLLKSFKETFTHIASNKQTTGLGHVTVRDLKRLKIALPSQDIMNQFGDISNPIFNTLAINLVENERLIIIRNSFLPKLMSGEIRVPVEES